MRGRFNFELTLEPFLLINSVDIYLKHMSSCHKLLFGIYFD